MAIVSVAFLVLFLGPGLITILSEAIKAVAGRPQVAIENPSGEAFVVWLSADEVGVRDADGSYNLPRYGFTLAPNARSPLPRDHAWVDVEIWTTRCEPVSDSPLDEATPTTMSVGEDGTVQSVSSPDPGLQNVDAPRTKDCALVPYTPPPPPFTLP